MHTAYIYVPIMVKVYIQIVDGIPQLKYFTVKNTKLSSVIKKKFYTVDVTQYSFTTPKSH